MSVVLVLIGTLLLYVGGEVLVRSASGLAARLGVRPMVIGLTVVAFGTSAPELAASLTAALSGTPEIAIGNVVGSNIANVGLILGITAMIFPLVTGSRFVRREVPHDIEVYPGARHSFFNDRNPRSHDAAASEDAPSGSVSWAPRWASRCCGSGPAR
ncbi:MAG: dienelactone hydrolase family protein [Deinococcales bacterium]